MPLLLYSSHSINRPFLVFTSQLFSLWGGAGLSWVNEFKKYFLALYSAYKMVCDNEEN